MKVAEHIVDALLENIRACAACQKEKGITPVPGTSHGMCKRHAIAQLQDIIDTFGPDPETQAMIDGYAARDENDPAFAPTA